MRKASLVRQFATAALKLTESSDTEARTTLETAAATMTKNKTERKKLVSVFDEFVTKARKAVSGK